MNVVRLLTALTVPMIVVAGPMPAVRDPMFAVAGPMPAVCDSMSGRRL